MTSGEDAESLARGERLVGSAMERWDDLSLVNNRLIANAIEPLGVDHVEMPLTNERVWRAIQDATR